VLPSAAATCTPERTSGDEHARLRFLELQAAGDAADDAAESRDRAAADAARVAFREHDRGSHDEVSRDHLAAAHVRSVAHLAGAGELPLLLKIAHAGAALDDDEAVGLLDHHADEAHRRGQFVARERGDDFALRLDDGHRAHRLVALLKPAVALAAVGAGGALDDAATLTGLGLGDAALRGGDGWNEHGADGHDDRATHGKAGHLRFLRKQSEIEGSLARAAPLAMRRMGRKTVKAILRSHDRPAHPALPHRPAARRRRDGHRLRS
jgi:hypothetical protein